MHRRRAVRVAIALSTVLSYVGIAAAAPHRAPHESAILECHQDILDAARTLTSDVEGHLGRCLTHGLDCLVSSREPAACCARVAGRCDDDLSRIHDSESEFERLVSSRACTRVPFADLLAAEGLDLGTLADRCACLSPPIVATSLNGLAACLRRVIEDDAIQRLALLEAPRTHEALACLGLDEDFPAVSQEQSSLCETCPAGTPSPTPTLTAVASPTIAASPTVPPPTAVLTPQPSATPSTGGTSATTPVVLPSPTTTVPPTAGPTGTAVPTAVATVIPTQVATPVPSATAAPTASATALPTVVATLTPPPTPTLVPVPTVTPTAVCGNGIVEGNEECDGAAIDDTSCLEDICTCDDFCDDAGGTLSCNANCTLNFSNCTAGGCSF